MPEQHVIPDHLWGKYLKRYRVWINSDPDRFRTLSVEHPEWGGAKISYILSMPEEWRQRFWLAGFKHAAYMKGLITAVPEGESE